MESSRIVDAYSLLPRHILQQADAAQAYTQAELKGVPTWVELPEDARPEAWKSFKRPVCPLRLACTDILTRGMLGGALS